MFLNNVSLWSNKDERQIPFLQSDNYERCWINKFFPTIGNPKTWDCSIVHFIDHKELHISKFLFYFHPTLLFFIVLQQVMKSGSHTKTSARKLIVHSMALMSPFTPKQHIWKKRRKLCRSFGRTGQVPKQRFATKSFFL